MLNTLKIWILLSALLVASGWGLSAVHELNRIGYGTIFACAFGALVYWRPRISRPGFSQRCARFKRRFRRSAPLIYLILALMSLAGGALYPCTDLDTNAYRTPRILHWLGNQQWHWIHTLDIRMNIAGCNFEWLSAPVLLFTRTDHWIFLLNLISYLLLPGLIFDVFTRLKVSPRTAYWWMWFLSSGWCYLMQAGSFHNDSFAVVYALAAVSFALRARQSQKLSDLWLSVLAVGLLTGVKQTAIPLALLWLVAAWPSRRLLLSRPAASIGVLAVGLLVSAVPLTFFNLKYTGAWTGLTPASDSFFEDIQLSSPFWGILGNSFCLAAQNLLPPYFPLSSAWNSAMQHFTQTPFGSHFTSFENFCFLNVGISEKNAGIGLGICLLAIVSFFGAWHFRRQTKAGLAPAPQTFPWSLFLLPYFLLLLFMSKIGAFQNARLLAPYYVFFFPLFLANPAYSRVARQRWWQHFGLLMMAMSLVTLMLVRSRPLFPADTLLGWLHKKHPHSHAISQALNSFSNRLSLENVRSCFKGQIPTGEKIIGYAATIGMVEPGLWLPWGERRVQRVLPADTSGQLLARGIHYVVVENFTENGDIIEGWMAKYHARPVAEFSFKIDPYQSPTRLYLVCLQRQGTMPPSATQPTPLKMTKTL